MLRRGSAEARGCFSASGRGQGRTPRTGPPPEVGRRCGAHPRVMWKGFARWSPAAISSRSRMSSVVTSGRVSVHLARSVASLTMRQTGVPTRPEIALLWSVALASNTTFGWYLLLCIIPASFWKNPKWSDTNWVQFPDPGTDTLELYSWTAVRWSDSTGWNAM